MKAYGKFIAAKQVEIESRTSTGIIISSGADKAFEIVSLWSEAKEFKVWDKLILWPSYQGEKVRIDSEDIFFFNSDIVLGVY